MTTPRESKYVKFARWAYDLAQEVFPPYSHPKSPHRFTQPQKVACVLLMHYLRLSYRDMEEWLLASDKVCVALELQQVPDHSTLSRTNKQLLKLQKLDELNQRLLTRLQVEEEAVVVDSTGFQMTQASLYYHSRTGRKMSVYWKGVYGVGIRSQLILARAQGIGPDHDGAYLECLRRRVRAFVRKRRWLLLGDAGFDSKTTRPTDLIPPRRPGGRNHVAPERKARADLVDAARLDGFFGQRWKVETVMSVIKRKLGGSIRARTFSLQRREPALKALVYNIHR